MMRKIATALGYAKAPRASFVLRHPVRGTKAWLASRRGRPALHRGAGVALGAAVALPLAYLTVRRRGR